MSVVTVSLIYKADIADKATEATIQYKESEDKERIMIAINQGMLETLSGLSQIHNFSYQEMPERIKNLLEEGGFTVEVIEDNSESTTYKVGTGHKNSFRLRISKIDATHELTIM